MFVWLVSHSFYFMLEFLSQCRSNKPPRSGAVRQKQLMWVNAVKVDMGARSSATKDAALCFFLTTPGLL
jgi:hypothetical protein